MDKKKKIIIGVVATLTAGAFGWWIYNRQSGAKKAIEANTVDPTTGLTPLEAQSIAANAGPLAAYENKIVRLAGDVKITGGSLMNKAPSWFGDGVYAGMANPCMLIKNGGFQIIAKGMTDLVVQRVYGIKIKDCSDGVKKGLITNITRKQFNELKKYELVPESIIKG